METTIDRVANEIRGKTFIQGGSHRIELGPKKGEVESFRCAVDLFRMLKDQGEEADLGCLANDLALSPDQRPKNTGEKYELPKEYSEILDGLPDKPDIFLFWESTLRNKAKEGPKNAFKKNERLGIEVPTCPAIMGAFYKTLERSGYKQVVGFYPFEESCGPVKGADCTISGYELRIKIRNFFPLKGRLVDAMEFLK